MPYIFPILAVIGAASLYPAQDVMASELDDAQRTAAGLLTLDTSRTAAKIGERDSRAHLKNCHAAVVNTGALDFTNTGDYLKIQITSDRTIYARHTKNEAVVDSMQARSGEIVGEQRGSVYLVFDGRQGLFGGNVNVIGEGEWTITTPELDATQHMICTLDTRELPQGDDTPTSKLPPPAKGAEGFVLPPEKMGGILSGRR